MTDKISDDVFLVIDQVFLIFRIFTLLNVVYDPFFTRKTTISQKNSLITPFFYSVRTFARIRQHYFSKFWGDGCPEAAPHLKLWGDRPHSHLGLRPCRGCIYTGNVLIMPELYNMPKTNFCRGQQPLLS